MTNNALYNNEWVTPIQPTRDWQNYIIEKSDKTQITVPINQIKFDCAKIDAILIPKTHDATSNKYANAHVIIINPVEPEDYAKVGIPGIISTPKNPAFYIICDDGHQAIAFCDELIINNIPLNVGNNLYYSREQVDPDIPNSEVYVLFSPGPEAKTKFDWNIIDPILQDLNTSYNEEAIEGGYYISKNITNNDIENAIKRQNMIPQPMSLLSMCWTRMEVGIGG